MTLTIEPGVEVRVQHGLELQVDGTLIARGTSAAPITFTSDSASPNPGDWISLEFINPNTAATFDANGDYLSGSILEHVIVEYAGGGTFSRPAISSGNNAAPFITHSIIRKNLNGSVSAANQGDLRFTDNTVTDNAGSLNLQVGIGSGTLYVARNTISNNRLGQGLIVSGTSIVTQNTITNNSATGVFAFLNNQQSAQITGNLIRGNGSGIIVGGDGPATITGNRVLDSRDGGIRLQGISDPNGTATNLGAITISENIIKGNLASGRGGGIATEPGVSAGTMRSLGPLTITRNVIAENRTEGIVPFPEGEAASGGGGVYVSRSGIVATSVTNNAFIGNSAGAGEGSAVKLHPARGAVLRHNIFSMNAGVAAVSVGGGGGLTPVIQQNNFYNNLTTYDVKSRRLPGNPPLDATNNWWGTADEAAVRARIYDFSDDATIGVVNYLPLLSGPNLAAPVAPPAGLTASAGVGGVALNWHPSPESDMPGYMVYYGPDPAGLYTGTGANEGSSPIDVGNVTNFTLTGLTPGTYYVTVTAYNSGRDGVNDQTEGNESWFAAAQVITISTATPTPTPTATPTPSPTPLPTPDACQTELEAARSLILNLQNENGELRNKAGALQQQNSSLQDQVSQLQSQLAALQQQNQGLTQQNQGLVQQNSQLQNQVGTLTQQNSQLQTQLGAANNTILTLNNGLSGGASLLTQDFRQSFNDPAFTILGNTPLEQFNNLVSAILQLDKGRKGGLYKNLGGKN